MDYDLIDPEVFTVPLLALLVRARKVITDAPDWRFVTKELVEDIDNELGEVPEAGRGAYDVCR